jgi:hypothetical protein
VPVEQPSLPAGELDEVLSSITWPDDVLGCVLVIELHVQFQTSGKVGLPAPPARLARVAVGVLRDGRHSSSLHVEGDVELILGTDLADDIVALLLGTF